MDGGQFFGDVVVKVERKDLFDFTVTLTEEEFNDIKVISDFDNTPIEDIFCRIVEYGFDVVHNGIE